MSRQLCIKEAMRLCPGVSYPLERVVPPEGAVLGGTFLPGGTTVGVNAAVIHRNRAIYGDDADQFRPERWLGDPDTVKAMDRNLLTVSAPVDASCPGHSLGRADESPLGNSSEPVCEPALGRTFRSWRSASWCRRCSDVSIWNGRRASPSGRCPRTGLLSRAACWCDSNPATSLLS